MRFEHAAHRTVRGRGYIASTQAVVRTDGGGGVGNCLTGHGNKRASLRPPHTPTTWGLGGMTLADLYRVLVLARVRTREAVTLQVGDLGANTAARSEVMVAPGSLAMVLRVLLRAPLPPDTLRLRLRACGLRNPGGRCLVQELARSLYGAGPHGSVPRRISVDVSDNPLLSADLLAVLLPCGATHVTVRASGVGVYDGTLLDRGNAVVRRLDVADTAVMQHDRLRTLCLIVLCLGVCKASGF